MSREEFYKLFPGEKLPPRSGKRPKKPPKLNKKMALGIRFKELLASGEVKRPAF